MCVCVRVTTTTTVLKGNFGAIDNRCKLLFAEVQMSNGKYF